MNSQTTISLATTTTTTVSCIRSDEKLLAPQVLSTADEDDECRYHHHHHQQQQHRGRGYGRRYARGGRGHATGNGYFTPDTEKVDYSDSRFRQVRNPPLSTHDGWGRMEGGGTRAAYGYPGQRLHSHTRATNSYINNNNNNNNSTRKKRRKEGGKKDSMEAITMAIAICTL
mmetsp:Transcript_27256/g.45849  ORF Transcript_27256/g.45849 Transcript_27256/m.45849 type:complete len:171 (-) Transcript_27256:418-930(-)